ncbi:MAG: hypothetical protein ACLSD3_04465 [Acutalibacteraceae bacterium]
MIEIKISNASPIGLLSELVALSAYQLESDAVRKAADKLLTADKSGEQRDFPVERDLPAKAKAAPQPAPDAPSAAVSPTIPAPTSQPVPAPPTKVQSPQPSAPPRLTAQQPSAPARIQPPTAQPAVPVAPAPQYTYEQLQLAGQYLLDAGKLQELQGLLQKYGIRRLPDLPREQYGAYATDLRGLGARI